MLNRIILVSIQIVDELNLVSVESNSVNRIISESWYESNHISVESNHAEWNGNLWWIESHQRWIKTHRCWIESVTSWIVTCLTEPFIYCIVWKSKTDTSASISWCECVSFPYTLTFQRAHTHAAGPWPSFRGHHKVCATRSGWVCAVD